jgi:hypothetical protein
VSTSRGHINPQLASPLSPGLVGALFRCFLSAQPHYGPYEDHLQDGQSGASPLSQFPQVKALTLIRPASQEALMGPWGKGLEHCRPGALWSEDGLSPQGERT